MKAPHLFIFQNVMKFLWRKRKIISLDNSYYTKRARLQQSRSWAQLVLSTYIAAIPPSIRYWEPEMNELSSLPKNTTRFAMSSALSQQRGSRNYAWGLGCLGICSIQVTVFACEPSWGTLVKLKTRPDLDNHRGMEDLLDLNIPERRLCVSVFYGKHPTWVK